MTTMEGDMKTDWDIIIIGGGTAGLSAAQYGARANLRTLLIEEMAPGGLTLIISDLENYPGFPEPIQGFELAQRFTEQAEKFGAEIMSATVTSIDKQKDHFTVEASDKKLTAYTVILATGAQHRKLEIPGEEDFSGKGVSYCATCDGPLFKNKKLLVVGGGDAACDEAMFLSKITDKVTLVHRRDRFRAQPSLAQRVQANNHIEVRFNHEIKEIKGDTQVRSAVLYNNHEDSTYEEEFDAVFVFIGSIPQTALVPDAEKDEIGYIITDQCMRTSIPGLYAVGDVRNTPFRQIVVGAGDGAVASHCAAQYIDELKGQSYD